MSRETNTLLFIIGGVVYNLVVMGGVFFAAIFVLARVFSPLVDEALGQILLVAALLLSIGVSLFSYYRLVRWLQRKIDFDRYFTQFLRDGK